jgi:hypothetical protein
MVLKIAHSELGAIGGTLQRILYDSATNSLALTKISASLTAEIPGGKAKRRLKQTQSQSQLSKKLSHPDKEKLEQIVTGNGFFETDVFYPPDLKESQHYALFVLSVVLDDKLHTVVWTDTSRNVPTCLNLVIEALQEVAK